MMKSVCVLFEVDGGGGVVCDAVVDDDGLGGAI